MTITLSLENLHCVNFTEFKKLNLKLDEASIAKLATASQNFEGKSPIKPYNGESYLSVGLSRYEKNNHKALKKYEGMVKCILSITIELDRYDFADKEDPNLRIVGWSATLVKITRCIKVDVEKKEKEEDDLDEQVRKEIKQNNNNEVGLTAAIALLAIENTLNALQNE
jgi:hypothetical protein